jgi:hypothetical protein
MRQIDSILYWENKKRITFLESFLDDLKTYFNNSSSSLLPPRVVNENSIAKEIRPIIAQKQSLANSYVIASGNQAHLKQYPAPSVGGPILDLNLILNVFHLLTNFIDPNYALDTVNLSIGRYKHNRVASIIRIFNPIFYYKLIVEFIVDFVFLPFRQLFSDKTSVHIKQLLKWLSYVVTIYQLYLWWGDDIIALFNKLPIR